MFSRKKLSVNEEEDNPRNNQVNMYFATKKFTKLVSLSFTLTICSLIILGIAIFSGYYGFEDRISQSGTYITLYGSDCVERGYVVTNDEYQCFLFIPSPNSELNIGITMGEIIAQHYVTVLWIGVSFIIITIVMIGIIVIYRPMAKPLRETLHQYIQESYFLNIQLTATKGATRTERIFNLLLAVFPEVYLKSENEGGENIKERKKKIGEYTYDFYMDTKEGKFAGIFFEGKLTLEKLKEFTNNVKNHFESEDDRVICIAKEFDLVFESDELEEKIDGNINGEFQLDVLKEDDNDQFSIIWID